MPYSDTDRIVDRVATPGDDRGRRVPDAARVMTESMSSTSIGGTSLGGWLVVMEVALFEWPS